MFLIQYLINMNALFIWNKLSVKYIEEILNNDKECQIISSIEDFEIVPIEEKHLTNIFILVELDWENNLFYGYDVAYKIMVKWQNDQNPPNIQFLSFLSQENLYDLNKNVYKFYSKSFFHYQLPLNNELRTYPYSPAKFKYLKKYALTESGILDTIKHDLEKVISDSKSDFSSELENYIVRLKNITSILGSDLNDIINAKNHNPVESLNKIFTLIVQRLKTLNELKDNPLIKYEGIKEKIILVEDDINFGNQIQNRLNEYFDVDYYRNGFEAREAIELNGINYQALITDLELLNTNGKTDQEIQGIEVFEFTKDKFPHIVRRIVSGLPRKGISELVEIDINDILYKSLISYYGFNDGFDDWVKKLKSDIKLHKRLKHMKGPNNTFWKDVEYKIKNGKKRASGSGFKRLYYNFKIEDEVAFQEMWKRIYDKTINILKQEDSEKVSTTFIKTTSSQNLRSKKDKESTIELLERILTHRLLWISYYDNNSTVIYKDVHNFENSFYHKPFWDGELNIKPTDLFTWLGFSTKAVNPKNKDDVNYETEFISIFFQYNSLFEEEEKFRVKYDELLKSSLSNFSKKHESLCKCFYWILINMKDGIKKGDTFLLKIPENYLDIDEKLILETLSFINNNHRNLSQQVRNEVADSLNEFMDHKDFKNIPTNISSSIDRIVNQNILF